MTTSMKYDVALSFAGEDREFVSATAKRLKGDGIRVFYDEDEKVEMWGKNLGDYLDEIYRLRSKYVVMFISQYYAQKAWTNHERQSALARAISERREYVLPARFDSTELPGLQPTIGYIDLQKETPNSLADMIIAKVRGKNDSIDTQLLKVEDMSEEDNAKYKLELEDLQSASSIYHDIVSQPHWRTVIRPAVYKAERIDGLPDCLELVSSCCIRQQSLEFPHLNRQALACGNNWISESIQYTGAREFWRMYQSGQFVLVASFREDFFRDQTVKKAQHNVPNQSGFQPSGYHDVFLISEIVADTIAFTANYVNHGIAEGGAMVGLFMNQVQNRILFYWDNSAIMRGLYKADSPSIGKYWAFSPTELARGKYPLTLKISEYIYHRFGWLDVSVESLLKGRMSRLTT